MLFAQNTAEIVELGMEGAANRARTKLVESLPDSVRKKVQVAMARFQLHPEKPLRPDIRIAALAQAIRMGNIVQINTRNGLAQAIHPSRLVMTNLDGRFMMK